MSSEDDSTTVVMEFRDRSGKTWLTAALAYPARSGDERMRLQDFENGELILTEFKVVREAASGTTSE